MSAVTDPKVDEGDIINFGECVTYLMFPYLTCGDSDNWTTAIAIANTTMDDGVFGISGGAAAQSGKIMLHAFPRSMMGEDGMMTMHDPMRMELTESLAAGDTYLDHLQQCHARVCRLCHRQGKFPACPWSGLCPGQFRWRRNHRFGPRLSGSGDSRSGIRQQRQRSVRVEKRWGSNPAFHAEFKGSHASGYPFFWV